MTVAEVIIVARRKVIADEVEVVRILSDIARGEAGDEPVKVSERLKAAELLGRKYDLFSSGSDPGGEVRVVVDYVGKGDGEV